MFPSSEPVKFPSAEADALITVSEYSDGHMDLYAFDTTGPRLVGTFDDIAALWAAVDRLDDAQSLAA